MNSSRFKFGSEEINGMEFPLLLLRFKFGSELMSGMEFPFDDYR